MAKEAESMNNQNQSNLVLNIRMSGDTLKEYGLLAYHNELSEHLERDHDSDYWTRSFEEELVKMMQLIKRYNDEVKELVK